MHRSFLLAVTVNAGLLPRQVSNPFLGQGFHQALPPTDPVVPAPPATAPADNTFSNGLPVYIGMPPETAPAPTSPNMNVYGLRTIDLPWNRLHLGQMSFFPKGQLNTPTGDTDVFTGPGVVDSASQSACGIPDNAYYSSKVAIHPYFLKYAPLDRYCMPDVCISFWPYPYGPGADMILKVTDICSTDPNDPTHCPTPGDIKIDRSKAKVWSGQGNTPNEADPEIQGDVFPRKTQWYFRKCWGDGIVQPAYANNWFAQPPLDNSAAWSGDASWDQWNQNQLTYAAKGWPTNDNCAVNMSSTPWTITDWVPGTEPSYTPIAGGRGFGPAVKGATPAASAPAASAPAASAPAASAPAASAPAASAPATFAPAMFALAAPAPEAPANETC